MDSISSLSPELAETLHLFTHYLRIKGIRVFLGRSLES
jgi:hypothetical protein